MLECGDIMGQSRAWDLRNSLGKFDRNSLGRRDKVNEMIEGKWWKLSGYRG